MARLARLGARAARRIRRMPAVGWVVERLPPGIRRAIGGRLRSLSGGPAPAGSAPAGSARARSPGVAAPGRPARPRRPFVPDGSGADPRINVLGHFRGEFGVAEAARSLVTAAQAGGIRVALRSAHPRDAQGRDLRLAEAIGIETPHPINVICVNANETAQLVDELGPEVIDDRYAIGFWFWELAHLPEAWHGAIDRIDEIWVASEFVAEAMRAATPKPVRTVRLAVEATPSRTYRRSEFGLSEDAFTFLFTFNVNSFAARKNPLGTIAAFRNAFPRPGRPVELILKSTNLDPGSERMRPLVEAIGSDDRIRWIDRLLTRDEVFGLESVVDSYVSLHRSEGFGLGLAESMFLGKPVIGTAYSGNLEFMDETNSLLVDYRLVDVGAGEYPFPEGQVWAEPDVDQAAELMRRLVDDRAFGRELGARARAHMLREFSNEAVGARLAARLKAILDGET
jgi:glycosyltransferase involved in cell wall biosynthesis